MSLIRDPVIITAVGHQMMTAGGDITYTKATLYGQDISHLTKDQLESLTSIGNPLLTVPVGISDKSDNDSATTIVIEATFQNANLKADLPYTAVGFFAKRGDDAEKLVLVGVANPGAYLVATSPDGIATDALDIKVAIAIGDATSVTAVVDPAGSVTPATLNGAINKLDHDISAKIDAKADKTTVEGDLATKANQSDLDQTNAEVAKKANISDVYTKSDVDSALAADRGRLGKLEGTQTLDSPDFNSITASGVYYITNNTPANLKNNPVSQWGVLVVSSGNGKRISQVYYPDDGSPQWCRLLNGSNWLPWYQLSTKKDVTNAVSLANKVNVHGPLYKDLKQFNNWSDLFDDYAHTRSTAAIGRLVAFRDDTNGGNTVGSFGSGIAFGGGDTSGVLSVAYSDHQARITAGNGGKPVWSADIAWKTDVNDLQNQIQQLKDNQFEVQTFTDATAAANWESQRPGKRMAIVNS